MNLLKRISAVTACILICTAVTANASVKLYVNGYRVNKDILLESGTTYVPIRALSEALGANVQWDNETQSVFVNFTEEDAIAKVVENASPSVVTIIGNHDGSGAANSYNNPTAHGSGVIYKSNGYIITNAHVVEDIKNITVVLTDSTLLPAKVLYSDKDSDLAIIKVESVGLRAIDMADPSTIVPGKTAIAIGTPISLSMRNSVTKGIVSGNGVSTPDSHYKLIQTDAAINPGNSGGPLLNSKGELIGINSSKFVSSSVDNMGFAIPVDTVKYVINQFEQHGKILRPSAKLSFTESWEAKIGLPTKKGITVQTSDSSSLLSGDVVNSVNGIEVHSITDWNEAIKNTYNGTELTVNITRNGVVQNINIK
ncbi:MAG: trypsin-like peptidase domain-containing protein [Clostridia bacterium]|nr:trypsin-like peptidase domain-containing protein [Clostridia bacterium]